MNSDATPITSQLSKRQLKKLNINIKWLATKQQRKKRNKEKLKQKKEAARKLGIATSCNRKYFKQHTMAKSICKQSVVIDMSFEELMSEKDLNKCLNQIHRSYSANRRTENPLQLYVCSFKGKCEKIMEKNAGYRNWDVNFKEDSYMELFSNSSIVYLTSDSDNVLKELDDTKVYIIGGLVDHNFHKGICHKMALHNNISHARLPIDENVTLKTRKVLTIDHVFNILLLVSQGSSWKDAFIKIIPSRKGIAASNKT